MQEPVSYLRSRKIAAYDPTEKKLKENIEERINENVNLEDEIKEIDN